MTSAAFILPLDGEGARRGRAEGVNPGVRRMVHLAPIPSTTAAPRSPSPIKGEDGAGEEASR